METLMVGFEILTDSIDNWENIRMGWLDCFALEFFSEEARSFPEEENPVEW